MAIALDRRLKGTTLQQLGELRLADAWVLLKAKAPKHRNGAVYLGGYSIECALKARICRDRGADTLPPEFYSHSFHFLAEKTTLWPKLQSDERIMQLFVYLESEWAVQLRYHMRVLDPHHVRNFLNKSKDFTQWLFVN